MKKLAIVLALVTIVSCKKSETQPTEVQTVNPIPTDPTLAVKFGYEDPMNPNSKTFYLAVYDVTVKTYTYNLGNRDTVITKNEESVLLNYNISRSGSKWDTTITVAKKGKYMKFTGPKYSFLQIDGKSQILSSTNQATVNF